jgi:predicted aldo/keto reductase-like oxidoreductase
MRLPFAGGVGPAVDRDAAIALIQAAQDGGVNYFDTAFGYHSRESEAILGEALHGARRGGAIIATKQPFWEMPDDDTIRRNLENTLIKLRTDCIDIYLLHRIMPINFDDIRRRRVFEQFQQFQSEGMIKHIGFSYHGNYEHFKTVTDAYDWEVAMVQHNMLDTSREVTSAGVEYAAARGLGVVIMEPLRGGGLCYEPTPVKAIYEAAPVRRTPTQWALRYLADKPQISCILSGMTQMPQLEENLSTMSAPDMQPGCLSAEEHGIISRAAAAYESITQNACTGCDYCVPCPVGVKIPHIFGNYNDHHRFEHSVQPRRSYALFATNAGADATRCTACGECIPKCPQNIDIPTELQRAHADLFGWKE